MRTISRKEQEMTKSREAASSPQRFHIGMALLMIGIAVVGFWGTYFGPLVRGTLDAHWLIDVHAAVFSAWLVFFLGQAVLASRNQIRTHQKIGSYFGVPWGLMLLVIGFFVTFAVIVPGVGKDHAVENYAIPLMASLGDLVAFGGLFVAAVLYRKRPAIHKRLMLIATISLMEAPIARLARNFGGLKSLAFLFLVSLFPLFIAMGYDRWTRDRIHPAYWIGLGVLVLKLSRFFWAQTETWHAVASWLTGRAQPIVETLL